MEGIVEAVRNPLPSRFSQEREEVSGSDRTRYPVGQVPHFGRQGSESCSLERSIGAIRAITSRTHWGIENQLHWLLDMAFREDEPRHRAGNCAANLTTLRHFAVNLLKLDKTKKVGVANKRKTAGWDRDYLLHVLLGTLALPEKFAENTTSPTECERGAAIRSDSGSVQPNTGPATRILLASPKSAAKSTQVAKPWRALGLGQARIRLP